MKKSKQRPVPGKNNWDLIVTDDSGRIKHRERVLQKTEDEIKQMGAPIMVKYNGEGWYYVIA